MIEKTYLSRCQSRALALDHPVGDPTGGVAYGQKRAPVVAVVGMATSFSGMAAGSIMAGIAFAGSALTLVGSLTGNKTLSTIGMIAGGIGGAGMAGLFGETVQAATWGSTFGGAAETAASTAATGLSQSPAAAIGNQTPVVDGVQAMPVSTPGAMTATPLDGMGQGTVSALNAPGGGGLNAPSISTGLNAPAEAGAAAAGGTAPLSQSPGAGGLISEQMAGGATASPTGASGFGSGAMEFIKGNPELTKILAQGASGLSDYLSGIPDAQLAALEAQTGYADARALQIQEEISKEKQRRANLNAGYQQVNQTINVNPNANMTQQQPQYMAGGLIAGAQAR